MKDPNQNQIIIYQSANGKAKLEVKVDQDTVWLSQKQIAKLFGTQRPAITKHLLNIFKSNELKEKSVSSILEHTAKDGKTYKTKFYNLDVIISIGYRINSKYATQFRIWATSVLRNHILKGYTLNKKRLKEQSFKEFKSFEKAVSLIKKTINSKQLSSSEADGLLHIITDYADSWLLLQKYDENQLKIGKTKLTKHTIDYSEAQSMITELKKNLIHKKEATKLFGNERNHGLEGILGSINQTFSGKDLYPSIEEKAAHLLYFIIKDHPFTDGNKRIGSFIFIVFLANNLHLYKKSGEKKINDNTLVAMALLIAQSDPKQKKLMVELVINFLTE